MKITFIWDNKGWDFIPTLGAILISESWNSFQVRTEKTHIGSQADIEASIQTS